MSADVFVDTNVLVYARDASEPEKQPAAARWLEQLWIEQRGRTSMQVLNEYYVTATSKLGPGMAPDEAWDDVDALLAWEPQAIDTDLMRRAVVGDRIISPIRKTDTQAREIEATSVDFPIHPDVQRVIVESRRSSLRLGRCPFIVHRAPDRQTKRAESALDDGRMLHPAQVLPEYASKAFNRYRQLAAKRTSLFDGLEKRCQRCTRSAPCHRIFMPDRGIRSPQYRN